MNAKSYRPFLVVFVLICSIAFVTVLAAAAKDKNKSPSPSPPQAVDPSQYVGSDTCKSCHEDLYKNFETSPHFKTLTVKKWGPERHGCEACHGPGKAHVDGGGDTSKIINPKNLSAADSSKRCMTCHMGQEHSNFSRSMHLTNGVGCTSCHDPHHAVNQETLLVKAQPTLCYGCHGNVKAEFGKPFHHKVNEGFVQCSDCHNEHGGFLTRQLRNSPEGDYVCFKCHSEKRGPFTFEHVPVKAEGCQTCHTPHGSTNPRLLRVATVNLLCIQCHTPTGDRPLSAAGDVPGIPGFHNQNQKYQACTMCHTQIHGSNFSDVFFR